MLISAACNQHFVAQFALPACLVGASGVAQLMTTQLRHLAPHSVVTQSVKAKKKAKSSKVTLPIQVCELVPYKWRAATLSYCVSRVTHHCFLTS
jgi:hypothetical protein